MVIKIERLTHDNQRMEFTVSTNNIAHSVLSDNPDMKTSIEEAIHLVVTKYLRGEYND